MTPTTDAANVARIAGGLTKAQRNVTVLSGNILGMPLCSSLVHPLIRRGIFERFERHGFQVRWHLTPLGLAVRNHLEASP